MRATTCALVLLLLATGCAARRPAALITGPPALSLQPDHGPQGTRLQVEGSGFPARTRVTVHLGPPHSEASGEAYATAVTDGAGRFRAGLVIPPPAAVGARDTIVALATTAGWEHKAIATFKVAPAGRK